jgi:solute:Na+ symporter, SSS family
MSFIDWSIIVLYGVGLFIVIALTKRAKTMDDFAVGSRMVPGSIVFASLFATFIGPGFSMGLANNVAGDGLIWLLVFFAFSLQTLLIGYFIAPRLRAFENARTLGDIMGYRYGKATQFITGILSVALCTGLVGAITKASADIIYGFTGLPFMWAVLLSAIVVLLYSTLGGVKSVVATDVVQFVLLGLFVPVILIFIFVQHDASTLLDSIPSDAFTLTGHFSPAVLLGLFLAWLLSETLIPPLANRALMAKDAAQAKKGFLLSGGFSIIFFVICSGIGLLALGVLPAGTENYYLSAMQSYLPVGVLGLAVAAMISIVMSSQDSCLNAASVSFTTDILALLSPRYQQNDIALTSSRIMNVLIGVFAVIMAIQVPNVVEALMYCYTLWMPTIVLPLIIAVLKKNVHPYAGFFSMIGGGLATGIWELGFGNPYDVPSMLIGIAANQVVFWVIQSTMSNKSKCRYFQPLT